MDLDPVEVYKVFTKLARSYIEGTSTYAECQNEVTAYARAAYRAAEARGASYSEAFDEHWKIVCKYNEIVYHLRHAEIALKARIQADMAEYDANRKKTAPTLKIPDFTLSPDKAEES